MVINKRLSTINDFTMALDVLVDNTSVTKIVSRKDTLKQCEITPSDLESLARDRTTWRTTCRNAVQRFEEK